MKNIVKRVLSGLVIGSLMILPGIKGKAFGLKGLNGKGKITKQIELYGNDFKDSRIINNLEINSDINYIIEGNNYNLINSNNNLGFIEKDNYLDYSYNGITYKQVNQIGVTTSEVNLRVSPSVDENKIITINNGELLEIIYQSDNGWYLVNYNDILGFIKDDYAKVIDFHKIDKIVSGLPKTYKAVVAKDNVNIRSNPSIASEKMGVLKKNKKLLFSKKLDNGWIEVTNNIQTGYIKEEYVCYVDVIDGNYYKQVYMKNNACIYSYPYSSIVEVIPKYETAFVYGETDDFYYIESSGIVGFIRKIDTEKLDNKYVVVDISDQKLTLYYNTDKILKSSVVTGKDTTPTDLGCYKIYNKELGRILTGPDYQTYVDYWLAFNDGEGLHDASWRNSFGGSIYHKKGSHGCVNLPTKMAKQLYNELSVGDKVLIKK